jgi:hypothetical protein
MRRLEIIALSLCLVAILHTTAPRASACAYLELGWERPELDSVAQTPGLCISDVLLPANPDVPATLESMIESGPDYVTPLRGPGRPIPVFQMLSMVDPPDGRIDLLRPGQSEGKG